MTKRYIAGTSRGGHLELVVKGNILYCRCFGKLWRVTNVDDKVDNEGRFSPIHDFRKGTIMLCKENPDKQSTRIILTPPVKSLHKVPFFADEIKSTTKYLVVTQDGYELKFIHNWRLTKPDDLFFVDETHTEGPKLRLVLQVEKKEGHIFNRGETSFNRHMLSFGAKVRYGIPRPGKAPELRELRPINHVKKADTFDDLTRHLEEITGEHEITKTIEREIPAAKKNISNAKKLLAVPQTDIIKTIPKTKMVEKLPKTRAA